MPRPHKNKRTTVAPLSMTDLRSDLPRTRAGIIFYTIHDGQRYYLLGIDSSTQQLTDFGGGFESERDRDRLDTAIREFTEETLYTFELDRSMIEKINPICLDNRQSLIVFIPIEGDPAKICKTLETKINHFTQEHNFCPEMCGVTWLQENELYNCITRDRPSGQNRIIYKKVGDMLREGKKFIDLL